MDFDDILKIAFKIGNAIDEVKDQKAGESEEIVRAKQKIYGRRKVIRVIVDDVDD